mgnify:CR=1 FL=1
MHPKYWKFPLRKQADGGDAHGSSTGGTGPLDSYSAASAFEARLNDEPAPAAAPVPVPVAPEGETDEQAAERLAREEAGAGEQSAEQTGEPQKFKVPIDGKEVELTAAEVAEAYKGQMRDKDYRQKTMEAADVRKTADAELAQARAQREEYAAKLEDFSGRANYELNAVKAQLTDDLLQNDPVAYLQVQRIVEARQAELSQAQQELHKINDQRQKEQADARVAYFQDQHQKLVAKIPEWADPAKADAGVTEIKKYLSTQEFAPDEQVLPDHRLVILARKAMQYDALMERARTATQKVASAPPKVERPGNAETSRPGDGRTTAMKNLQKTGSIDAAAAAFSAFL